MRTAGTLIVLQRVRLAMLSLLCGLAPVSVAQTYPSKPVRIVVPVASGGATDIIARTLSQRLTATLGHQVLVDNRPGGGSNIGFEAAAKSAPDGLRCCSRSRHLR